MSDERPKAERHATVRHADGLHARPAEMIARAAMGHAADIALGCEGMRVDAKSILDVLTLGAEQGVEILVEATGPDAEAAAEAIAQLIESDFGLESGAAG